MPQSSLNHKKQWYGNTLHTCFGVSTVNLAIHSSTSSDSDSILEDLQVGSELMFNLFAINNVRVQRKYIEMRYLNF